MTLDTRDPKGDVSRSTATLLKLDLFTCSERGCSKYFKSPDGLRRHIKEKHSSTANQFLCPLEDCLKGVPGAGLQRRYRLVNHLMSAKNNRYDGQGHGMTKNDAERAVAHAERQAADARRESEGSLMKDK